VDPILVSVIANRLDSITKEIGQTMMRTSRSPIFSEARDFVTAIYDRRLRLVAQTAYIPVLLAATPWAVRAVVKAYEGDVYDGDVFIVNDPYHGNNHPPDVTVLRPVFFEGELCFWSLAKGHHADIGGKGVVGYNPGATSIHDEGIMIPPAKLYDRGKAVRSLWDIILNNVTLKSLVEGDLHCQVGATSVGERSLKQLLSRYGIATIEGAVEEILEASDRQMRQEIERVPDGVYRAESSIDNDGIRFDHPVTIRLTVRISGDQAIFDYSESDPQVPGFINSPYPNTVSATYLGVFAITDPNIAHNEGAGRQIQVIAPEGSIVNPVYPAPVTACTVPTAETIVEAVWAAIAQAVPEKVQAAWGRWCGQSTMGFNPRTGRPFGELHFMGKGGAGAMKGFDGWDHLGTVICLGGLRSPDPELHELLNPYFILQYEYLPNSAGPGEWRGGMGTIYRWRVDADGLRCANFGSGTLSTTAPFGLEGGSGSAPNEVWLIRNGKRESVECNTFPEIRKGDVFEIHASGGGGYGNPRARDVEKVRADTHDGLVSVERARNDYGVALDPKTFVVDARTTARLRTSTS